MKQWHLDPSSNFTTIDMGRKSGCAVPLSRGAEFPFNTMSPGPRPTSVRNGIFIHPAVWPQQTWAENSKSTVPFGGATSPCNNVARADVCLSIKWRLNPSSRLATTDTGRKRGGGGVPLFKGELGPHVTRCGLCWGLPQYQVAPWSMQPFGHNTWPKLGVLCPPPLWGQVAFPSNNVAWAEIYLCTKWHLNPSSRLATTDMDRKLRIVSFFGEGELGPHLKQYGWGRGLPPCQVYAWVIEPFGHNTPTLQTDIADRQTTVW